MAQSCPAAASGLGMVQSLLGSVDCNVQTLAQAGYGALASPGSPVAQALTILLTLYIAFMGLRLMLGLEPLRVGELTMSVLKIGVIVALATNWPTYQQLVFDVLLKAPEQLGASILKALQPPSGSLAASPFAGLQAAYDELQRSALFYSGKSIPQASPMLGGAGFAAMSLTLSGMLLLLNTLGALLAAKIVLALLLAVGPVFVVFLLFDATRGLFEGWVRAALAVAFVPLLAIMGLVVQLIMLEPQLIRLADLRSQNLADAALPSGIFLLSLIFTGVTAALIVAVAVIAFGFRLPVRRGQAAAAAAAFAPQTAAAATASASAPQTTAAGRPGRAAQIAMAAAALDRRDARAALTLAPAAGPRTEWAQTPALASSRRRLAQPRRAASNQRRDR
jgi:type IV secretion system protein VirB6